MASSVSGLFTANKAVPHYHFANNCTCKRKSLRAFDPN